MAVHAADVTLGDLFKHRRPPSPAEHPRKLHHLRRLIDMVEFQERDVGLSAVDARVVTQKCVDELVLLVPLPSRLPRGPRDVVGPVPDVVLAARCRMARATEILPRPPFAIREREIMEWLLELTPGASLRHADIPDRQLLDHRPTRRGLSRLPAQRRERCPPAVLEARTLSPIELCSRAPAVTVAATDIALCDLGHHQRERTRAYETSDRCALQRTIAMVEVQEQDVGLAAVDAWMLPQVVGDGATDS